MPANELASAIAALEDRALSARVAEGDTAAVGIELTAEEQKTLQAIAAELNTEVTGFSAGQFPATFSALNGLSNNVTNHQSRSQLSGFLANRFGVGGVNAKCKSCSNCKKFVLPF